MKDDKIELGRSIQALSSGTKVIRLIDRDLLSPQEVADQKAAGVHVLNRRNIESYLLDDEVIEAFALKHGDTASIQLLKNEKSTLHAASVARGKDTDDLKPIAGEWYTKTRRLLGLTSSGSTWEAFAVEFLAPLVTPETKLYQELKTAVFEF